MPITFEYSGIHIAYACTLFIILHQEEISHINESQTPREKIRNVTINKSLISQNYIWVSTLQL